jgi:hypothetical protein
MYSKYKADFIMAGGFTSSEKQAVPASTKEDKGYTTLNDWKFRGNVPIQRLIEEVQEDLGTGSESAIVNPREYWRVNQDRYHVLAMMAGDIFSVPPMSVEVERIFSGYTPEKGCF